MRMSEGMPKGRFAELYHPEMFQEHEKVIVFTREEFSRFHNSMMEQINYVNNMDLFLDRSEDWKLLGYWPKLMEKVHIIDVNMETILTKETSLQTYLDASIFNTIKSSHKNVEVSKRKVEVQLKLTI